MNRVANTASIVLSWMAAGTLLIASIAKLTNIDGFAVDLRGWSIVPKESVGVIAVGIPSLELIAALYFVRVRGALSGLFVIGGLYGVFTIAILLETVLNAPPKCGCLGPLQAYAEHSTSVKLAMIRNVVLLGGILLRAWFLKSAAGKQKVGDLCEENLAGIRS